jgi:hypothetical protein
VLIALLVALGVDLIVVVGFAALVLGRKRWLKRQPGRIRRRDSSLQRGRRQPQPEMEARFWPVGP